MNTVKIIKPDVQFITPIDGWLARQKLKGIGCGIEEWYREEGGETDA